MATRVLRNQLAPWIASLLHAALGAVGIVLLLWYVLTDAASTTRLAWILALFIIAAVGGFFLAALHARQKLPPKLVVVVHAGVAVVAFGLLATAVVAGGG